MYSHGHKIFTREMTILRIFLNCSVWIIYFDSATVLGEAKLLRRSPQTTVRTVWYDAWNPAPEYESHETTKFYEFYNVLYRSMQILGNGIESSQYDDLHVLMLLGA